MKSFALLAVLGACVFSAQAYTKCDKATLDKIKSNFKDTPLDLKPESILSNGEGVIAYVTTFYFPGLNIKCATSKLETKVEPGKLTDYYSFTTYNIFNEANPTLVKVKLEKDDVGYYTKDSEGRKIYNIPFYKEKGVVAYYTCADKDPKNKLEDSVKDAAIKVQTLVTAKSAEAIKAAVANAKPAVDKAKEIGKNYGFNWDAAYGGPENCEEAVKGPKN